MSEDWMWWYGEGSEPERYSGPFATREEAVSQAMSEAADLQLCCVSVCEAVTMTLRDDVFDADFLIDRWHDGNDQAQDEDGYLSMSPDVVQRRELEEAMAVTFAAWRARHGLGKAWAFADTRNYETIQIADAAATAS